MANPDKFAEIAEIFEENTTGLSSMEAGMKSVIAIKKLMGDIGLKDGLKDFGVREENLRQIAEEAIKSGNVAVNPRCTRVEDLIMILQKAMNGLN